MSVKRVLLVAALLCGCHKSSGGAHDMSVHDASSSSSTFDLSCAGSTQKAKLVPVNLVVLLDRSGSMGDGTNGDPKLKWIPVTQSLDAFFADPASAGMQAALTFFNNPFATSMADECNPGEYMPAVPMTPLPDAMTFSNTIAGVMPMGDTPTLPALEASLIYAENEQAMSGARSAVVLVTDGYPDTCDSSVPDVALQAAKAAGKVPTYVIGVGDNISGLNQIAMSGGTTMATFVSVGDANKTKSDFLTALEDIRGLVLKCDFAIPPAPAGKTIDFQKVNVLYTPSTGKKVELLYDNNCAGGDGWVYDNPQSPTRVELCPQTCTTVRADHGGEIDVVFGCDTDGNLII